MVWAVRGATPRCLWWFPSVLADGDTMWLILMEVFGSQIAVSAITFGGICSREMLSVHDQRVDSTAGSHSRCHASDAVSRPASRGQATRIVASIIDSRASPPGVSLIACDATILPPKLMRRDFSARVGSRTPDNWLRKRSARPRRPRKPTLTSIAMGGAQEPDCMASVHALTRRDISRYEAITKARWLLVNLSVATL